MNNAPTSSKETKDSPRNSLGKSHKRTRGRVDHNNKRMQMRHRARSLSVKTERKNIMSTTKMFDTDREVVLARLFWLDLLDNQWDSVENGDFITNGVVKAPVVVTVQDERIALLVPSWIEDLKDWKPL